MFVCASLAAAAGVYAFAKHLEYLRMHTIPAGLQAFDVNGPIPTCGRWKDTMPKTRDPAAYRLYINARKLWRSKIEWQLTRQEALGILHDVQAAANQGDWGARALMAYFYRNGLGPLEKNHVLDPDADKLVEILRSAVAAGQAWGYYDLGVAHEHGYGGAAQDDKIAWAYYRKAAELGSPEAQMALASAYLKAERRDAEKAIVMCAYRQDHGPAAYDLGMSAKLRKDFRTALEYYQAGTRFGSKEAAVSLMFFFDSKEWSLRDKQEQAALKELDILPDPERESRYHQIYQALDLNPDLKLTRLDKVLPLPPAELPAWNGIQGTIEPEPDGPPSY
ncbi:sel1 repeat family protein [Massilia buxea]|uniref:Sel1 repeat family protein n=2 Tax=Pseudoduganella buxea TaxID=1949069 RepID=A0A6I3SUG4_9BURK|nr:sel1 repeat family protein [Pseudoduganella buxea]